MILKNARPLAAGLLLSLGCTANADEGMWTYDNFPLARVNQQLSVKLTPAWLDQVRLASVRLQNCSASFVSAEGLILTNHHCVVQCLADNSSKEQSFVESGHVALTREREMRCKTQIADVLIDIENITDAVKSKVATLNAQAANEARKAYLTERESACEKATANNRKTGPLKCQSVTLYEGGQYFLYKYRRYSDIRLVFAPEASIAAFGGDPDNFQYPRWCLDMALLRAYDAKGQPARSPNFMPINFDGAAAGEAVFVSGNPGSTDRLLTTAQYRYQREVDLPPGLLRSSELRGRYIQFAETSDAARRISSTPLQNLENGIKVRRKLLDALLDDRLMTEKRNAELTLRERAMTRPDVAADFGDPWADIERALEVRRGFHDEQVFIEGGAGFNSRLFNYARALVRVAAERDKPNTERLREFTDAALPRLEQQLGAQIAEHPELSELTLAFSLERMREWLGPDHSLVRRLLSSESPQQLARRVVRGTSLASAEARTALYKGGAAAIAASTDPMIVLAREIDPQARELRKRFETEVEAPIEAAAAKIAKARFAIYGTEVYPDATFTPRLSYGTVQAWTERGVALEPFTRLGRLFERATGAEPFLIPESWQKMRGSLDMSTPFNLSTNNDIVGGNSGSPLINARGEVVGLMFDGNIHSIAGDFWFDTAKNRAIVVHPSIMREAMLKVYGAQSLFDELSRRRR